MTLKAFCFNLYRLMKSLSKIICSTPFVFLLLFAAHSSAYAQTATPTPRSGQLHQNVKDLKQAVRQDLKNSGASPSGAKSAMCAAHIQVAKLRTGALAKRASGMQTRLDKIATMVEAYYTNKLVPEGKNVATYSALVADVSAKKAALSPLVTKVQSDSDALTCDGDNAKGQFVTFRTDATALISAFKAYRLSVINLVQAVRKASGVTGNISPTLTPAVTGESDL